MNSGNIFNAVCNEAIAQVRHQTMASSPNVYLTTLILLAMAVVATWGICEYTCNSGGSPLAYGSCSVKATYGASCMNCRDFCDTNGFGSKFNSYCEFSCNLCDEYHDQTLCEGRVESCTLKMTDSPGQYPCISCQEFCGTLF